MYEYSCCCGKCYIRKTTQQFSERIKQHVPARILKSLPEQRKVKGDSAITKHLKDSNKCISDLENLNSQFRSLAVQVSDAS